MAYFDCIVGNSGSGTNLVVTCSPEFAGQTITCTNGSKTYTKTCPSSSPYIVIFKGISAGTWTVSGSYSGQTFSTSVVVSDFSAALNAIPDGSTITPTDSIQTWLHCANIWDKTYTTISQVLADSSTLLTLIYSNNAADYMARSTTWASSVCANSIAMTYIGANDYCANKLLANSTWSNEICNSVYFESVLNIKVPTMTSTTTPSGVASASAATYGADKAAWKAFDGNTETGWATNSPIGTTLSYQFPNSVKCYKVSVKSSYGNGALLKGFDIINENNTTLGSYTFASNNDWQSFIITNPTNCRTYTLKTTSVTYRNDTDYVVRELQFYGRA